MIELNQQDLNDFFSIIGQAKKENEKRKEELVSNSFEDYFWKELEKQASVQKSNRKKKIKNKDVSIVGRGDAPIPTVSENTTLIEKSINLLSESEVDKQENDPLLPLNRKFVTLEDLNKHYNIFISRVQQQLSTLGGGGEVNLTYMDVPTTSVITSSYTVKLQDYYIGVNYAGAVTINLPKADREGKIFVIKDESGEASKGTNRYITILPSGLDLIDGRDKAILAFDYGSLTFIWKGNSWRVI